jgi:cysteine desulfuration protein SufE
MGLTPHQQALLNEIRFNDDPQERLAAVVDRARRLPKLGPGERTDTHRVRGCSSSVWLIPELREGRCYFRVGADSPVVLGLVALLADFHAGSTPAEIISNPADPLETLDLTRTLSPTRRHGLAAVHAAIRAFAVSQLPTLSSPP